MNYAEMSDFEINLAVAKLDDLISKILVPFQENDNPSIQCIKLGAWYWFNPCNSWADAGPIIQENYLSIECDDMFDVPMSSSYWKAYNPDGAHYTDVNPLRAAMIVFLMMQESK